jgi:hypothetical protein
MDLKYRPPRVLDCESGVRLVETAESRGLEDFEYAALSHQWGIFKGAVETEHQKH